MAFLCYNSQHYLTLRSCLNHVCLTLLFELHFALQPCLSLEKSTTVFSKFVYENAHWYQCVALFELF